MLSYGKEGSASDAATLSALDDSALGVCGGAGSGLSGVVVEAVGVGFRGSRMGS